MVSYMISYLTANVFSQSELILQDHVRQHNLNINVPEFEAFEVDHDMHRRLMQAAEGGYIEVIDMWEGGDRLRHQFCQAQGGEGVDGAAF